MQKIAVSKIFSAVLIIFSLFLIFSSDAKAASLCKCSDSDPGHSGMPEGVCIDFCCTTSGGTYYSWGADSASLSRKSCSSAGIVAPLGGDGAPCHDASECESGLKCLGTTSKVCVAPRAEGGACESNDYCASGLECINAPGGACAKTCSSDSDCSGGKACFEGHCGAVGSTTSQTLQATPTGQVEFTSPIGQVSPSQLVGKAIKTVLGIIGAIALLIFVYGGLIWMTSGGSPEKIKKAQTTLVWAVLGMIVIFASYAAVDSVLRAFGV